MTTAVLAALAVGYFVTQPDGSSETDKSAQQIAECLARYPMPGDAVGFARRVRDRHSMCGGADVLEYTDLADPLLDTTRPSVRLVLRIHFDEVNDLLVHRDAVTACYRLEFNYYGLMEGDPHRVDCPKDAAAITPPPEPRKGLPSNMWDAVEKTLQTLPPAPGKDDVLAAIQAKLPVPVVKPPTLDVAVQDKVVVVAASSTDRGELECQFAVKTEAGEVDLWYPDRSKVPANEFRCDATTALERHPAEAD